jgi:hypothetical protein
MLRCRCCHLPRLSLFWFCIVFVYHPWRHVYFKYTSTFISSAQVLYLPLLLPTFSTVYSLLFIH